MTDRTRTLTRHDYLSDEVYEIEQARIFHAGWFLAGRADRLAPGNRMAVDVAGEPVLVTRALDGTLHAFANVCRHRGARLGVIGPPGWAAPMPYTPPPDTEALEWSGLNDAIHHRDRGSKAA